MLTVNLSRAEALEELSLLKNMCISSVTISSKGRILIGIGKIFCIEHLCIPRRNVPEVSLLSYGAIIFEYSDGTSQSLSDGDEENADKIVGKCIQRAEINASNGLSIYLDDCVLRIGALTGGTRIWKLYQPGTEENQIVATLRTIVKLMRQRRRWSDGFRDERDRWHCLYGLGTKNGQLSTDALCNLLSVKQALSVLAPLVGSQLCYVMKSHNVNLYDFGFKDRSSGIVYSLHVTCSWLMEPRETPPMSFWGDTAVYDCDRNISSFVEQQVEGIQIDEHNALVLQLSCGVIRVIPADDGEESWRFFLKGIDEPHLVASDSRMMFG